MSQITRNSYYNALKNDELLGLKCRQCGQYTCPPKPTCNHCGSREQETISLTRRGIIKTFTVIRVAPLGFSLAAPYIVAMVELPEGPWLTGNLIGVDPAKASMHLIGQSVEVTRREASFDAYTDAVAVVPAFKLI